MADQFSDAQVAESEIGKLLQAIGNQKSLARVRDLDVHDLLLRTQLVAAQNHVVITMSLGKKSEHEACERVRELLRLPPSE